MISPLPSGTLPPQSRASGQDKALWKAAQALEASFLSEMLKAAGLGKVQSAFGGGAGEEQFSSFLVNAQAEQMARAGGIGLAHSLFEAMKKGNGTDV